MEILARTLTRFRLRCTTLGLLSLTLAVVCSTSSNALPLDDFEDGNLDGWSLASATGERGEGTGDWLVEARWGSQVATVHHRSAAFHSMSQTLDYDPSLTLSFDMEVTAASEDTCCISTAHGYGGVEWVFLDSFNQELGHTGAFYGTLDVSTIDPNYYAIPGNTMLEFDLLLADIADRAGLGASDPIAKMTLSFAAFGQFVFGGNIYPNARGSSQVWVDNVQCVPEPSIALLLGATMVGLAAIRGGSRG